jgi:LemA protein
MRQLLKRKRVKSKKIKLTHNPKKMTPIIALIAIVSVFGLMYVSAYNSLIKYRQQVKEAWAGIDVQLKRRHDLIPNLVNTVKGYAKHEAETLEKVIQARNAAMSAPASTLGSKAGAENMLTGTLKSLFALSENYPDLKANQNFIKLQDELTETEDQIAASRRIYNSNVEEFNSKIEMFPSNVVANFHHFKKAEFFELTDSERKEMNKAAKVEF